MNVAILLLPNNPLSRGQEKLSLLSGIDCRHCSYLQFGVVTYQKDATQIRYCSYSSCWHCRHDRRLHLALNV